MISRSSPTSSVPPLLGSPSALKFPPYGLIGWIGAPGAPCLTSPHAAAISATDSATAIAATAREERARKCIASSPHQRVSRLQSPVGHTGQRALREGGAALQSGKR